MSGPREKALTRAEHWVVEVALVREATRWGGFVIRAADGVLSTGDVVALVDAAGKVYPFPPLIDGAVSVTETLGLEALSVSLAIHFVLPEGVVPADLDLDNAWGRLGRVDENADGDGCDQTLERVEWWIEAPLTGVSFGDSYQQLRFTLQGEALDDGGFVWPAGSDLQVDRFPDVGDEGNTTDRPNPRAIRAVGVLPPIVVAPAFATDVESPLIVVQDETVNYDGAHTYAARRLLASYEPMSTGPFDLYLMGREQDEAVGLRGTGQTIAAYQAVTLLAGVDGLGDPYSYVNGLLEETTTAAALSFTAASTSVTGGAGSNLSQYGEGDQIRRTADIAADLTPIVSVDNGVVTLQTGYPGGTGVGTGKVVRLTVDAATAGYLQVGKSGAGGVTGRDGRPIANPGAFIRWLLRRSVLPYPVAWGDIDNLEARCAGWAVATCLSAGTEGGIQNVSPWDYMAEHVLNWLPVVPYLSRGRLRFAWDGWVSPWESRAFIDLDNPGSGVTRTEPVSLGDAGTVVNEVRCGYSWSIRRQRFLRRFIAGGYPARAAVYVQTGRSLASQARHERAGQAQPARVGVDLAFDAVSDGSTAGLAVAYFLLKFAEPRLRMTLDLPGQYRWLEVGDCVQFSEVETIGGSRLFRLVSLTRGGDTVRGVFEALPSTGGLDSDPHYDSGLLYDTEVKYV